VIIEKRSKPDPQLDEMVLGNAPYDGGHLILARDEISGLGLSAKQERKFIRPFLGSSEVIEGVARRCIWIENDNLTEALAIPSLADRVAKVRKMRLASTDAGTNAMASRSHQFREMNSAASHTIAVPIRSSENREYLPADLLSGKVSVSNLAYAIYDGSLLNFSILASRIHLVWIAAVCGKLETRFSYSNKMGWNTFPMPTLTEKNISDLTVCAEGILLARESHFPASIADIYDPETMPANLREAHEANDLILERVYIGRRFRNDTERLEKLFDLYTKANGKIAKKGAT
jgi:hypothetical protein